ncbi:MAG: hypothetical protein M3R24_20865 [Chloroflexota bacterium]|nr:hypothetical protein [Chloroflexota bacterium]
MRSVTYQVLRYFKYPQVYFLLILLVFTVRCLYIDRDVVDDAAISLSYARNVANGDGFVLNHGGERVEGYSNMLLVLLLALGFKIGIYDLLLHVVSPVTATIVYLKAVGLCFGIGTLVLAFYLPRVVYDAHRNDPLSLFAPLFLTISTSFVTWTVMGLENPMYSFFILLAAFAYLREQHRQQHRVWSALLFTSVALIRPEGVLYFGVAVIHRILYLLLSRRKPTRHDAIWLGVFIGCYGLFLVWRYTYFGYWVPNTFYAKVTDRHLSQLLSYIRNPGDPGRLYITTYVTQYNVLFSLVFVILALITWRYWRTHLLLAGILGGGLLYVVYVGGDWWHEFRFLSPLLPIVALLIQAGLSRIRDVFRAERCVFPTLAATLLVLTAVPNITAARQYNNTVPLKGVVAQAQQWQSIAAQLQLHTPKFLQPDVGGISFMAPDLRIVDLGMLTDIHLARFTYYPPFFKQYIFEEERPEFLHTHGGWSLVSKITLYPELREHYLPINVVEDSASGGSGDYIRKDLFVSTASASASPPLARNFGELQLRSLQLETAVAFPGQQQRVTWSWQCVSTCQQNYTFYLAIRDATGTARLAETYTPVFGWYPTNQWAAHEVVTEPRTLQIPSDLPTGSYRLSVGVSSDGEPVYQDVATIIVDRERAQLEARTAYDMSQSLAARGDWEAALSHIQTATKLHPDEALYREAEQAAQATWHGKVLEQTQTLLQRQQLDAAVETFLQAFEDAELPATGTDIQRRLSAALADEGNTAFTQHAYDAAFRKFRQAIMVHPANVQARHRLEDARERRSYIEYYCDTQQYDQLYRVYQEERDAGNVPMSPSEYERLYSCLTPVADTATLQDVQAKSVPLTPLDVTLTDAAGTPKIRVQGYTFDQTQGDDTRLNLHFEVLGELDTDYMIWMHGAVDDLTLLPDDRKPYGFANFDHAPAIPTSRWQPGRTYVDSFVFPTKPGTYRLAFGMYAPTVNAQLCPAQAAECRLDLGSHLLQ